MQFIRSLTPLLAALFGVYLTSLYGYLLFHGLAEGFSIVIACGIFVIAWNARRLLQNHYLLFIGIAYLFVGGIDFLHLLAYKGMGVFEGHGANLPTQLWTLSRYMEAFSLLLANLFFRRKISPPFTFLAYGLSSGLLLTSIFYWKVFPDCFTEGVGLTPFKIYSEYVICLILLAAIVGLIKNSKEFDRNVLTLIVASIAVAIVQELAFTTYLSVYGPSNMIGHLLKIVSFYLIYKAIIQTGLVSPWNLLFRDLKKSEAKFRSIFETNVVPIAYCNTDGRIIDANDDYLKLLGVTREELKAGEVRWDAVTPPEWKHTDELALQYLKRDGVCPPLEKEYIRRDGTRVPVLLGASRDPGESGQVVAFAVDLTERKRAEEMLRERTLELQQLNDTLEQRVQERTEELARTNDMLRDLSSKLISAQEDERKKIASDLHDTIGSCLAGIKFKVENALLRIEQDAKEVSESLIHVIPLVQDGIEECRRLQMDLRPAILDDLGLLATLSWFCRRFQTIYSTIRIDHEINITEQEIPNHLAISIFRVVQEAMTNIAKHSNADRIRLSFRRKNIRIELTIEDNGMGFSLEEVLARAKVRRGLGLSSMKERVDLSGGSFDIESKKGKGTILRASWPTQDHSEALQQAL